MACEAVSLDDPRWTALVDAAPEALPFHHPSWAGLLGECYGDRPFALVGPHGGAPVLEVRRLGRRRWISLPFTDECPPLRSRDGDAAALTAGLDAARDLAGIARLEVRARLPQSRAHLRAGVRHELALGPDGDAVFARFHKSQVLRNIRRAEREGVLVRRAESANDLLGDFYRLHLATRHRLGVPIQPRRFFRLLWERMIEPGRGFVLLAEAGGETVAGAVFLTSPSAVVYKFGASDARAWPLRPNHALFATAIRSSCEAGHSRFLFGRTDLEDEGLRAFKRGWDGVEEPLEYSVVGAPPAAARSGGGLSRGVIRRSPPWVCRAVGELLYGYAA
jgi:CelD/BcsL family acetyltransferase involved in cellulose biosynthesis